LKCDNPEIQVVGLRALKELVRAFSCDNDENKRKQINILGDMFLPDLEYMMNLVGQNGGSHQLTIMVLIFKVFYMLNRLEMLTSITRSSEKLQAWVNYVNGVLASPVPDQNLGMMTQNMDEIE
jgi:hypothetical protein